MRVFLIALLASCVVACGSDGDSGSDESGGLESMLSANSTWPYEVVGVLEIVEAGYEESESPAWAVGSIVTDDDEYGVGIEIEGPVISRAGIDIDSGKKVRAWLESPNHDYGVATYPVSRLESL